MIAILCRAQRDSYDVVLLYAHVKHMNDWALVWCKVGLGLIQPYIGPIVPHDIRSRSQMW